MRIKNRVAGVVGLSEGGVGPARLAEVPPPPVFARRQSRPFPRRSPRTSHSHAHPTQTGLTNPHPSISQRKSRPHDPYPPSPQPLPKAATPAETATRRGVASWAATDTQTWDRRNPKTLSVLLQDAPPGEESKTLRGHPRREGMPRPPARRVPGTGRSRVVVCAARRHCHAPDLCSSLRSLARPSCPLKEQTSHHGPQQGSRAVRPGVVG